MKFSEDQIIWQAARTHGVRTRGMALDLMPFARRLKKISKAASGLKKRVRG